LSAWSRLQEHLWGAKPEPLEMFSYLIAMEFSGRGLPEHLCGCSSVNVLLLGFYPLARFAFQLLYLPA